MDEQLLDVTMTVGYIASEDGETYPASHLYRLDVESRHYKAFIEYLEAAPGVVELSQVEMG